MKQRGQTDTPWLKWLVVVPWMDHPRTGIVPCSWELSRVLDAHSVCLTGCLALWHSGPCLSPCPRLTSCRSHPCQVPVPVNLSCSPWVSRGCS